MFLHLRSLFKTIHSKTPKHLLATTSILSTLAIATSIAATEQSHAEFTEHTDPKGNKYIYDTIKRQIVGNKIRTDAVAALRKDIQDIKLAVSTSNTTIPQQKLQQSNIVLADRHRVALCEWPLDQHKHNGDSRTSNPRALFQHVKDSGYDGLEITIGYLQKYFRNCSKEETARLARKMAAEYNLQIFGANIWWVQDYPEMDWKQEVQLLQEEARLTKLAGGQYLTFQMWLPNKYQGTAGAYRRDDAYLQKCSDRIQDLQQACWNEGMNCYIETHVQRISEDPQAFAEILKRSGKETETNGDLSHYIYRNFKNDTEDMKEILGRMGHTHQRMCRNYGDLSANVSDPKEDWRNHGLTWTAFDFSKAGLKGGLSSRVICGESGPMHGVSDPLTLDAKLVPLYRMMARWCDESAKGIDLDISPLVYNPFE